MSFGICKGAEIFPLRNSLPCMKSSPPPLYGLLFPFLPLSVHHFFPYDHSPACHSPPQALFETALAAEEAPPPPAAPSNPFALSASANPFSLAAPAPAPAPASAFTALCSLYAGFLRHLSPPPHVTARKGKQPPGIVGAASDAQLLDLLSPLAYSATILQKLWAWLQCGDQVRLEEAGSVPLSPGVAAVVYVFCQSYAHYLASVDEEEFYSRQVCMRACTRLSCRAGMCPDRARLPACHSHVEKWAEMGEMGGNGGKWGRKKGR